MQASLKTSSEDLKDNPFAAVAEQFGNLMMNAFKIRAGTGLYVLAACLLLITFIAKSRILTRFSVVKIDAAPPAISE
jgi:hypothetical protein